jgi:hypothetical protein
VELNRELGIIFFDIVARPPSYFCKGYPGFSGEKRDPNTEKASWYLQIRIVPVLE